MTRRVVFAGLGLGLLWHTQLFAAGCENAYEKSIPYNKPVIATNGHVNLQNTLTLRYDCKTFLAMTVGGIDVGFNETALKLIQGTASADNGIDSTRVAASAQVLGYEIAREDAEIRTIYTHVFKPEHDIDVSQTKTLQVGPLALPIRYGIHGTAELDLDARMRQLGSELKVTPKAKANAYVLASVDLEVVYGSATGDLLLVDGGISNQLGVRFIPSATQPSIKFAADGRADVQALNGSVTAKLAQRLGKQDRSYEAQIAHWQGFDLAQSIYQQEGKITDLPSKSEK